MKNNQKKYNNKFSDLNLVFTTSSVACLVAIVVQQLIVASSIYFLTRSTQSFTDQQKHKAFLFLIAYFFSLVLPFLPGSLSLYFSRKWKVELVKKLFEKYTLSFSGQSRVWINKKSKEEIVSLLNTELILTSSRLVESLYSFLNTALNVGFTAIGLTLFLDTGFLPIYLCSLFLSSVIYRLTIQDITQKELESQKARSSVSEYLRRSWDPLLLKNRGNFDDWKQSAENSLENYLFSEKKAEKAKIISSISLSISSFLPVLSYLGWRVFSQISDTQKVFIILVNMPRVFMLMNHTYAILCDTVELKSIRTLWTRLLSRLDSSLHTDDSPFSKINSSLISVATPNSGSIAFEEFMLLPHTKLKGVYTVRGPNGCGKSLSLLKLKEKYAESAYLLPAHHDLFVTFKSQLSSGQLARQSIEWIHKNSESLSRNVQILLLDEWNANMDSVNVGNFEKVLLDLSKDFLIVEVRHDQKINTSA